MIPAQPRSDRPKCRSLLRGPARSLAIALIWSSILAGCRTTSPEWIDEPPRSEGYVYATGSFVGSLFPNDNRENAFRAALGNLSQQIKVEVRQQIEVHSTETSSNLRQLVELATQVALENVEKIASWRDETGARGARGTEWVLIRAPISIDRPRP